MTPGLVIVTDYETIYAVVDGASEEAVETQVREARRLYREATIWDMEDWIDKTHPEQPVRSVVLRDIGLDPKEWFDFGTFLRAFLRKNGLKTRDWSTMCSSQY